jgi:hypothetical protein
MERSEVIMEGRLSCARVRVDIVIYGILCVGYIILYPGEMMIHVGRALFEAGVVCRTAAQLHN